MANLLTVTGGAVSFVPSTSWAVVANMTTAIPVNDGSVYSWSHSLQRLTLPASGLAKGYFIVARMEYGDTSNGRHTPQMRWTRNAGTGDFFSGQSGGYSRDNSEDRAYVSVTAFINNPSASSTYDLEVRRASDAPTGGSIFTEVQVIPLADYTDWAAYTSTDNNTAGGTTQAKVVGFTGTSGTNISIASDVVTVAADNARYLVSMSQFWDGLATARTQRIHGAKIDGTDEEAFKAYSYYRDGSNNQNGDMYNFMLETVTANRTIEMTEGRGAGVSNLQGGADVNGATTSTSAVHLIVVLELTATTEVFLSRLTTQSADLAGTPPIDLAINTTKDFADSASFTDVDNNQKNCVKANDYLFFFNVNAASNSVGSTARFTAYAQLTKNGTEIANTKVGDYMRNNQGVLDTFGWGGSYLGVERLAASDDIGVSVSMLSGSEAGGAPVVPAGWAVLGGINLDTMLAAAPTAKPAHYYSQMMH